MSDRDAEELERLAVDEYLLGHDDEAAAAWEAAHRRWAEVGDMADAARCAFWLAFLLMMRGHMAQAQGWLGRTSSIIEADNLDCAAAGYLLIPALLGVLGDDPGQAREMAVRATEIGAQFDESDLRALGTLAHGQALVALGDVTAGMARFDEVMVAVTANEVGPITSGIVYCAVILECMQVFDLPRAAEWTEALSAWCDARPGMVPYRGQCLVHRSQLQQAAGAWPDAISTIEAACDRLTDPPHPALGLAYYQAAELQRLRGAFEESETHYRQANRSGYQPLPGLALLELARGDGVAAAATIRRALAEAGSALERPALLAAAVDIFRATGDLDAAASAADELAGIAAGSTSEVLKAMADQASGTARLCAGDASVALTHLRAAGVAWHQLRMPYERARAAVLVGLACAALGDQTSAALEFDAAQDVFAALDARPDLERLAAITGAPAAHGALSGREHEVLVQIAAGRTNRDIAAELHISPNTVNRHLENIFAKLGVSSRAAATSYAYEHGLL